MKLRTYGIVFIQFVLVVLFVYAAVTKLIDHGQFYNDLRNSPVFGNPTLSVMLSWGVPMVELLVATLLLMDQFTLTGLYASAVLMSAFTFYIAGILLFSTKIPCSCGGVISALTWESHLVFNVAMTGLAFLGIHLFGISKKQLQ